VYEGPLQAYEQLVRRQRRLGLYQLIWAGGMPLRAESNKKFDL